MYQRQDLSFRSQGTRCAAWLYRPSGDGPHPIVVMAHGIGAVRQVRLPAYAERFVARGIAVLCFDYRAWGESDGAPRYVVDIHAQHKDIHAALDVATALPGIDSRRLALWGTSFGGGHALAVAAERRDLRAVIVQCAVADARAAALRAPPAAIRRWAIAAIRDAKCIALARSPFYVPLVGDPGSAAVMSEPDAEARYRAMIMEPSPWHNAVAARLFWSLPFYRPIAVAHRIAAPLLALVTDHDEICDGKLQAEAARRAGGTASHFAASHFEIYFGSHFERAVTEMGDFLEGKL
jgi:pimeloyl-ACP methyl ester carboxylesterase